MADKLNAERFKTGRENSWTTHAVKWARQKEAVERHYADRPRRRPLPDRHHLAETAETFCHGLMQAFFKRGLPRAIMSDNGNRCWPAETTEGLARLGIVHHTTLAYHPEQKGYASHLHLLRRVRHDLGESSSFGELAALVADGRIVAGVLVQAVVPPDLHCSTR